MILLSRIKRKSNFTLKGMTLVELLTVISIIAFLAVLISIYLRNQVFKGYDARKKAEIKRIGIAVEEYEKDKDCYPLSTLVTCSNGGSGLLPYIDKIPCDPVSGASYFYEQENSACPKWFRLYSNLQNSSDTNYQSGIGPNGAFSYEYSSANAPDVVVTAPTAPPSTSGGGGGGGGAPTPSPVPQTDFYGCISGVCTMIQWDPNRPGPICDPNFQNSSCYGQCGNPVNECLNWN